ncbi:MAG TPA: CHASE domain-containing protein [Acidimicrobiia bacterium]|nr:CHASE domain-containing protein [Acidimicrobiia bacterium]
MPRRHLTEGPTLSRSSTIGRFALSLTASIAAGAILVLTLVVALGSWYRAGERAAAVIGQGGEVVARGLEASIDDADARLLAVTGLFRASERVSAEEFTRFASDLGLTPGVGGIGYIAAVSRSDLENFVQSVTEEVPGFRVFELDDSGARTNVGNRETYYPLLWFEPADAFNRPQGFDSGSDPVRRAALVRAGDSDEPVATPFLRLFSEEDDDGFLLYRRVISPQNGELQGFVVVPMDLSDLLAAHVPEMVAATVTWQVIDITDSPPATEASTEWSQQVPVAGRLWQLEVAAAPGSPLGTDAEAPLQLLVGGLLLSLSFAGVAYLSYRRTATEQALKELTELTLAKDRFLASVSHELRTPLTGVLGYAELLRDHGESLSAVDRREMIRSVADQAFDLGNIIEDLLVSARAELHQLSITKVEVCPQAQLAQVIEAYGPEVAMRVKLVDEAGEPARAWGDPGRVRQVIRNLINNACRHGGPRIEVRIDEADGTVNVDVADDGPPLAPEIAERIFLPYQRASAAVGQPDSVGIGLSIARTLARLMGGDVTYERRDEWNVFKLTLPSLDQERAASVPSAR